MRARLFWMGMCMTTEGTGRIRKTGFLWKKAVFALALLVSLCVGAGAAYAAADLSAGVSGIQRNQVLYLGGTTKEAAFDGSTAGEPVPWLVLNKAQGNDGNEAGMYLVSRSLLGKNPENGGISFRNLGDNSDAWAGSNAQKWCADFYGQALTAQEQRAVLRTSLSDAAYMSEPWGIRYDKGALSDQSIFFLSAREVNDYFGNDAKADYKGSPAIWLLRSPGSHEYNNQSEREVSKTTKIGVVHAEGLLMLATVYQTNLDLDKDIPAEIKQWFEQRVAELTRGDYAARPAFNLDKTKVLFSSAAKGGKLSEKTGVTGLQANVPSGSGEQKLTLLDSSMKLTVGKVDRNERFLTIAYSGVSAGAGRYVSGIVKNENGGITYYGRLAAEASGTIRVDLSEVKIQGTDRFYLFVEECNGDFRTDYAGALKEVKIPDLKEKETVTERVTETVYVDKWIPEEEEKALGSFDAKSLVPLTVALRSKGTLVIRSVDDSANSSILLTGAAITRTTRRTVTNPVSVICREAFSKTTAKDVTINIGRSTTTLTIRKGAFFGSRVEKLVLSGKTADRFRIKKGAFQNSSVRTILVSGMTQKQYTKLRTKLINAGFKGTIKRNA